MSKFKKIDISKIKTLKVENRQTKADISRLGKISSPETSLSEFLDSLPDYLKARDLLVVAEKIAGASVRKNRSSG